MQMEDFDLNFQWGEYEREDLNQQDDEYNQIEYLPMSYDNNSHIQPNIMNIDEDLMMQQLEDGTLTLQDYMDLMHEQTYPNLIFEPEYVIEDIIRPIDPLIYNEIQTLNDLPYLVIDLNNQIIELANGQQSKYTQIEKRVYGDACSMVVNRGEIRNNMQRKEAVLSSESAKCWERNEDIVPCTNPAQKALEAFGRIHARSKSAQLNTQDLVRIFKLMWGIPQDVSIDFNMFSPIFVGNVIPRLRGLQAQRYMSVYDSEDISQLCTISVGRGLSSTPGMTFNWQLIYQTIVLLAKREVTWNIKLLNALKHTNNRRVIYMCLGPEYLRHSVMTLEDYGFGFDFSGVPLNITQPVNSTMIEYIQDVIIHRERNQVLRTQAQVLLDSLKEKGLLKDEAIYTIKPTTKGLGSTIRDDVLTDKQRRNRTTVLLYNFPSFIGQDVWTYICYCMRTYSVQCPRSGVFAACNMASGAQVKGGTFSWKVGFSQFILTLCTEQFIIDMIKMLRRLNPDKDPQVLVTSACKYISADKPIYLQFARSKTSSQLYQILQHVQYDDLNMLGRTKLISMFNSSIKWVNSRGFIGGLVTVHAGEQKAYHANQTEVIREALNTQTQKWIGIYKAGFGQYKLLKETTTKQEWKTTKTQDLLSKYRYKQFKCVVLQSVRWQINIDETGYIISSHLNYGMIFRSMGKKLLKFLKLELYKMGGITKFQYEIQFYLNKVRTGEIQGHIFPMPIFLSGMQHQLITTLSPNQEEIDETDILCLFYLLDTQVKKYDWFRYQQGYDKALISIDQILGDILDGHIKQLSEQKSRMLTNYQQQTGWARNAVVPLPEPQQSIPEHEQIIMNQDDDMDDLEIFGIGQGFVGHQYKTPSLYEQCQAQGMNITKMKIISFGLDPDTTVYTEGQLEMLEIVQQFAENVVDTANVFKE